MFRSGERTFRSGEPTFRSGEPTFRSGEPTFRIAEHRINLCKDTIIMAVMQTLCQLFTHLYDNLTHLNCIPHFNPLILYFFNPKPNNLLLFLYYSFSFSSITSIILELNSLYSIC